MKKNLLLIGGLLVGGLIGGWLGWLVQSPVPSSNSKSSIPVSSTGSGSAFNAASLGSAVIGPTKTGQPGSIEQIIAGKSIQAQGN